MPEPDNTGTTADQPTTPVNPREAESLQSGRALMLAQTQPDSLLNYRRRYDLSRPSHRKHLIAATSERAVARLLDQNGVYYLAHIRTEDGGYTRVLLPEGYVAGGVFLLGVRTGQGKELMFRPGLLPDLED